MFGKKKKRHDTEMKLMRHAILFLGEAVLKHLTKHGGKIILANFRSGWLDILQGFSILDETKKKERLERHTK